MDINTGSFARALAYAISASGISLLGFAAIITIVAPAVETAQTSLQHRSLLAHERSANPCTSCHRAAHQVAYAARGEQKFLAAYPSFKPETPWHTRKALSEGTTEAQWRVYHERWAIPGSTGAHDDALEAYVFEDGRVLVFTHYSRAKKIIARL